VEFNAIFLSFEPLSYFRTFVIFGIVRNQMYLFIGSLLCVGNRKIELSDNKVDDSDQVPG
jgi:hypothetical protein